MSMHPLANSHIYEGLDIDYMCRKLAYLLGTNLPQHIASSIINSIIQPLVRFQRTFILEKNHEIELRISGMDFRLLPQIRRKDRFTWEVYDLIGLDVIIDYYRNYYHTSELDSNKLLGMLYNGSTIVVTGKQEKLETQTKKTKPKNNYHGLFIKRYLTKKRDADRT